ncbi:hypothetical protein [Emcibacter sp. SYSU 3D8]|uniref:DedA family protein n=1 Tax=Emcibacter sp. SYSU 3D8 TaxID=3133969 RepID=UPI0031FEDAFD
MIASATTDSFDQVLEAAALFVAPFLHESLAFVGGAFLVHSGRMNVGLCFSVLLAGVIASDLGIYGLGRIARRHPRIAAWLPARSGPGAMLDRNLVWLIPVCRFVPGLLFTTFASCGLLGLNFRRFAVITVLTAAIYTSALLYAVLRFGDAVASTGRWWPWLALLAGLTALTFAGRSLARYCMERKPSWRASAGS